MTSVIKVKNLGKCYTIGGRADANQTFREMLVDTLSAPVRRLRSLRCESTAKENNQFWALKDVNFEVQRGEVVGIIGRNGAGKSTLLKILSRITEPTEGCVEIRGRVASLLEVGTGFHPELTGHENIYLNGAILGMNSNEISRKFDEIVAFAEVEKFIDTPVKHYSSGMYVRLAFSVAAHLEPEILVVDEVLAVGDAVFQKKCLGKMGDVAKEGRTVLFVSHNMAAVNRLCSRGIWIEKGKVHLMGPIDKIVMGYLNSGSKAEGERLWIKDPQASGNEKIRLRACRIINHHNKPSASVDIQKPFHIEVEYDVFQIVQELRIAFRLMTADGITVFTSSDTDAWGGSARVEGTYVSRCKMPANFLNEGRYSVTISADIPFIESLFIEDAAISFTVVQTGGVSGQYPEHWPGIICPNMSWIVERVASMREGTS